MACHAYYGAGESRTACIQVASESGSQAALPDVRHSSCDENPLLIRCIRHSGISFDSYGARRAACMQAVGVDLERFH